MNFQVEWMRVAEEELATIWLKSSDRSAVTKAIDELDRLLGLDPFDVGESRSSPQTRIWVEGTLGAEFVIDAEANHVLVTGAFAVKRRH